MLKLLQEAPGFAEITNRRPKPRSPEQLLTQMRPPVIQAVLPRRKLSVTTDKGGRADMPHPVKISVLTQDTTPAAAPPAP